MTRRGGYQAGDRDVRDLPAPPPSLCVTPDGQPQDGEDSSLAAMVSAIADGHDPGRLGREILRLRLITESKARGATWAQVGAAIGMSGQQAKREAHRLERTVKEELLKRALAGDG